MAGRPYNWDAKVKILSASSNIVARKSLPNIGCISKLQMETPCATLANVYVYNIMTLEQHEIQSEMFFVRTEMVVELAAKVVPVVFKKRILPHYKEIISNTTNDIEQAQQIFRIVTSSIAFAEFNTILTPSSEETKELENTIHHLVTNENLKLACIELIRTRNNDEKYKIYGCRLAICLIKELSKAEELLGSFTLDAMIYITVLLSLDLVKSLPITEASKTKLDTHTYATPQSYGFWHWQYVSRNHGFKALLDYIDEARRIAGLPETIFEHDALEYRYYVSSELQAGDHLNSRTEPFFRAMDIKAKECMVRFKIVPAWPLPDYTSDVILARILSGTFRYEERQRPCVDPLRLGLVNPETPADAALAAELEKSRQIFVQRGNAKEFYNASLKAINHLKNQTMERYKKNTLARAIGLKMWDDQQRLGISQYKSMALVREILGQKDFSDKALYRYSGTTSECIAKGAVLKMTHAE